MDEKGVLTLALKISLTEHINSSILVDIKPRAHLGWNATGFVYDHYMIVFKYKHLLELGSHLCHLVPTLTSYSLLLLLPRFLLFCLELFE